MKILNLTQHSATPEQVQAGVIDLSEADQSALAFRLTFNSLPSRRELSNAAVAVRRIALQAHDPAKGECAVMIGGAPFFMSFLERELKGAGFTVLYAFSMRESVEETQQDGSTRKIAVFRHAGFVKA